MSKATLARGAFIAALSTPAVLAMAGDLSYENDPRTELQKRAFESQVQGARNCMSGRIQVQLMNGVRDSDKIIDQVTKECGGNVYSILTQPERYSIFANTAAISANDASIFVRMLANDELNRIPGLKRSKPKP